MGKGKRRPQGARRKPSADSQKPALPEKPLSDHLSDQESPSWKDFSAIDPPKPNKLLLCLSIILLLVWIAFLIYVAWM